MTRICICIVAAAAALCAAEQPAPKKKGTADRTAAPAKPAASKAPAALTVPPGAVQTSPETWRYTAADGRTWTYRKTPFGLTRYEEKEQPATKAGPDEKEIASIKVVEDGDSVHFERPTPFGTSKWTRKKSELNDVERQALELSHGGAASPAQKQE